MKLIAILLLCLVLGGVVGAEEALKGGHICNTKPPEETIWLKELTPNDVKQLEEHTTGDWVRCPICGNQFYKGEYFTNHKQCHIIKEQ